MFAVAAGKCAHRCVGNDTCACSKGYKLKPDGKGCEGKQLLYFFMKYFIIRTVCCRWCDKGSRVNRTWKQLILMAERRASPGDALRAPLPSVPFFLRYQRVFAGSQQLPGRRALHQHRGLVPLSERGQLWNRIWTHWQQQLQRSATLPASAACRETPEHWSARLVVFSCFVLMVFVACWLAILLWCLHPDIDECETGIHNCGPQFVCQNTQGSFRCLPKVQCGAGFIQDALGNCIGELQDQRIYSGYESHPELCCSMCLF